jgi:hypothetical protein
MQNKASSIIIFIVVSAVLFTMFSVDQWSSDISKKGYITTGTGLTGAELYTGAVSEIKGRNSFGDYSVSEGIDVPGAVTIKQTDVENTSQKQGASANKQYGFENKKVFNQNKSEDFAAAGSNWIEKKSNATSELNSLLKVRTANEKTNGVEATKSKTDSKSTADSRKKGKTDLPGEPAGPSLPIGDGLWLMLMMAGSYLGLKRILFSA